MAAGQHKKRLNAAGLVSFNLPEKRRAKKKNLESSCSVLNLRSHISLEWDDHRKRAVAKKNQIGITWKDLALFIDSVPHCHTGLADVFVIPQEIFELENVAGILSYEVWETYLSETERNILTQFLPIGTETQVTQQAVLALLTGENLHFGNPFLKWGASLCSGNLHPDAILHQEQHFKANEKACYSELQKYHNDIMKVLQKWKERWFSCKDPEKEIMQKMWRKGFTKDKCGNSLVASGRLKVIVNSRKEEKLHVHNFCPGDGAKFMSYFKISKTQHQLVKKIKQSGDGIQSMSLNRVLGNIKGFDIQPYEAFEEEEQKKLLEYWLQLANRHLPAALAKWKERQLQRRRLTKSLEQEMAEKGKFLRSKDKEKDNPDNKLLEQRDGNETDPESSIYTQSCEDDKESVSCLMERQPLQRIPSLNGLREVDRMDMDRDNDNQAILKPDGSATNISEYLGIMVPGNDVIEQGACVLPLRDFWTAVSMPDSYRNPTSAVQGYVSHSELTLGQPPPRKEQPACLIDLESDILEENAGEDLLHRSSNDATSAFHIDNSASFFNYYTNQDRNGLFQPFFKAPRMIPSYPRGHKQPGVHFLATHNGSLETGQISGHFMEQQHKQLLEQRQMREKEIYMHQIIERNMHSNGGRYRIPGEELFSSVNVHDWAIDPVQVSAPPQHPLNGEEILGPNWLSREHQAHGGLSGIDITTVPGQCLENGSNNDESLFSVLSQYNKLQSTLYNPMHVTEQYLPARNFLGGGITGSSDVFPQTTQQLNCSSGHDDTAAAAALKAGNMSWMNLSNQSSSIHESIEKPFVRSWNQ